MATFYNSVIEIVTRTKLSLVFRIDLIVILVLIGLLIFKELYLYQRQYIKPKMKRDTERILYVVIMPLIYIFCYVLFYRIYVLS